MPNVKAGDLDVHYTEVGSGPPVVLLHGGLATSEIMWNRRHVERLANHYRVLMPDSRGHGRTNNPAQALSYPQMADDVAAFSAALSLERPAIVGYSDGAQIAIELGLRHPGLARSLVLGGVVISTPPLYFEMLQGMGITGPGTVDIDAMRAAFGEHFAMVEGHANWRGFVNQIATLWWTVSAYDDGQLATIRERCLVICGDRDRPVLDDAPRLFRALSSAELAVVPDSEHGAAAKDLFWTNVLDFFARNEAEAPVST